MAVLTTVGFAMAGTLDDVKAKGFISVGVNEGLFGFSKPDEKGEWRGLDVDTARAISAAVFGAQGQIEICALDRQNPLYGIAVR